MKKIFLVRHAKSSHDPKFVNDFERPLIQKGIDRATKLADKLKQTGDWPWVIISSPAQRAKDTAQIFAKVLGESDVILNVHMYEHGTRAIYDIITNFEYFDCDSMMFVGHNPELEDFIYDITGLNVEMTTSAVCLIESSTNEWKHMNASNSYVKLHLWGDGEEEPTADNLQE